MKTILFLFAIATASLALMPQPVIRTTGNTGLSSDTLAAQVAAWRNLQAGKGRKAVSKIMLKGATRDLSMLYIRAFALGPGGSFPGTSHQADADILVIVKDGNLNITIADTSKILGPGGVALFPAGKAPNFMNKSTGPVTYYVFYFQSRLPEDRARADKAGPPFLIHWNDMVMKKTGKGESRQIFNRPVAWLGKIDMHATTLNAGEVSHPPHTHRAEEIILMRSGNVQEYIDGKYYKASAGDLIFLPSGVPHALENKSEGRCEYFALQWQQ